MLARVPGKRKRYCTCKCCRAEAGQDNPRLERSQFEPVRSTTGLVYKPSFSSLPNTLIPPSCFFSPSSFPMSVSIDDLVSSFSASHVSQEAMDIATLQVFPLSFFPLCPFIAHPNETTSPVPARKRDLLSIPRPAGPPLRHSPQQPRAALQSPYSNLGHRHFSLRVGRRSSV